MTSSFLAGVLVHCKFVLIGLTMFSTASLATTVPGALLDEFETVVCVRSPFIPGSPFTPQIESADVPVALGILARGLESGASRLLAYLTRANQVDKVTFGASNFKRPEGIGPILSDQLYVIDLLTDLPNDLRSYFDTAPLPSIALGQATWEWQVHFEGHDQPVKFVLTSTHSKRIIVGTRQALVDRFLKRISNAKDSILPFDHAVLISRIWGYRKYKTYPVRNTATTGVEIGPTARSLLLQIYSASNATVVLKSSRLADATIERLQKLLGVRFSHQGGGTWRARLDLSAGEEPGRQLFVLLSLLGLGAHL